jgi:hypothetical protein
VSKDSDQTEAAPRKFKLGHLGSLNQVTKGLAKTIRAMADGTLDSQVGARICNGLGIMRWRAEGHSPKREPPPEHSEPGILVAVVTGNFLHEHHDPAPQGGIIDSHERSDQP